MKISYFEIIVVGVFGEVLWLTPQTPYFSLHQSFHLSL